MAEVSTSIEACMIGGMSQTPYPQVWNEGLQNQGNPGQPQASPASPEIPRKRTFSEESGLSCSSSGLMPPFSEPRPSPCSVHPTPSSPYRSVRTCTIFPIHPVTPRMLWAPTVPFDFLRKSTLHPVGSGPGHSPWAPHLLPRKPFLTHFLPGICFSFPLKFGMAVQLILDNGLWLDMICAISGHTIVSWDDLEPSSPTATIGNVPDGRTSISVSPTIRIIQSKAPYRHAISLQCELQVNLRALKPLRFEDLLP